MSSRVVAWVTALATAVTVAVAAAAPHRFSYGGPGTNLVIQTTAALGAVLVAVIAFARFRQRRRVADLLLVLALAQLATANLLFTALPLAQRTPLLAAHTVWAGSFTRLAGVVLLAAAAYAPPRSVDAHRAAVVDVASVTFVTATIAGAVYAATSRLPDIPLAAVDPFGRLYDTVPAMSALLVVTAVAAAVAAIGFVKAHAREPADELLAWLAVASVLACGSHALAAATFLGTFSVYVSVADVLKLASHVALLGGVAREVRGALHDRSVAAVADERRRIARDLHDGLAQELAFIVTRSRTLARRSGDDEMWAVCSSAERALDESRRAIAALSHDDDEAFDVALAHTADEVADRLGTRVTLELDPAVRVPGERREALLRIAREAITNAARHGHATRVHVRLYSDDAVRLRVSDNGRGFDATVPPKAGRLGVTGMRERASALGGELTIQSRRPGGTDVEVVMR